MVSSKNLALVPIVVLIGIITALYFTVPSHLVLDQPGWLIPVSNTLFVTAVCFAVSLTAMRSYLATGRMQLLLLGSGVLAFGIGGGIAGFVRGIPGVGGNANVMVYSTAALIGAAFHFSAALLLLSGLSPEAGSKDRKAWLTYLGLCGFLLLLTWAGLKGILPPFFIEGEGTTPLRQAVLGTAIILLSFSFLIFMGTYVRKREAFLYWYSLALALTTLSLTAFFIQHVVGSPLGWAGRLSQYLAGAYFLAAMLTALRSARTSGRSLDSVLTSALGIAEEKFRALAENSPDVIDRFDRGMRHLYVNQAGLRLLGKPEESVVGRTMGATGLPEPYCSLWKERIQQVFDTGRILEVEDYFPSDEGLKFYQSRCAPEFGPEGAVDHVLVVSRDITAKRRAEAELRSSEERFRTLSEATFEGIAITEHGRFVDVNDRFLRMLGCGRDEIIGRSVEEVLPPEEVDRVMANIRKGIESTTEHVVVCKDGSRLTVEAHGKTVLSDGHTVRLTAIRDITRRKEAEEQIRRALREKETLLRELYHRTKNNMNVISSLISLQTASIRDKEVLQTFRDMQNRIMSMSLVHQKLYQSGDLSEISLSEYLRELAQALLESYRVGKGRICLRIEADSFPISIDTAIPCGLALNELISNSLKYAFPDGREGEIGIETSRAEDGEIRIRYRDNGVGMPEPVDVKSTKTLGLKLVKRLIEGQLGGRVELGREAGTEFNLTFREPHYTQRI